MSDYLIKEIKPAQVVGEKTIPAVNELTMLVDAVDEGGKSVKIRGQRMNITTDQIALRISRLEAELAKWKAIEAEVLEAAE